jgi:hypothetical protein
VFLKKVGVDQKGINKNDVPIQKMTDGKKPTTEC